MNSAHPLDALRRGDQANKPYFFSPSFFQPVYGRDCGIRRRKDGNYHNYKPFAQIGWRFEEILDRSSNRTGGSPGIRLSDKTSRPHPRHVVPKPAQAYEPEVPVGSR
jgi:hypothetical protein